MSSKSRKQLGHFGPEELFVSSKSKKQLGYFGPRELFVKSKSSLATLVHAGELFVSPKSTQQVGHFGPRELFTLIEEKKLPHYGVANLLFGL